MHTNYVCVCVCECVYVYARIYVFMYVLIILDMYAYTLVTDDDVGYENVCVYVRVCAGNTGYAHIHVGHW